MLAYKITGDLSYECIEITQEEAVNYPSPQWYISETSISWTTHMYVNGEIKERPVIPPDPVIPPTKEQLVQQLDWEYQPQFLELSRAWLNAFMDGNTTLAEKRKTDKSTLEAEYYAKREVIENA